MNNRSNNTLNFIKGRPFWLSLFLLCCTYYGHGQSEIDVQIAELSQSAFDLRYTDLDSAFQLNEKALDLIPQSSNLKIQSDAYSIAGVLQKNKSDFDQAIQFHFKSLKIREELDDSLLIARSYLNIGNLYYITDQFPVALIYLRKSILISERKGPVFILSTGYSCIANVYAEMINDDSKQNVYLDSALQAYTKADQISGDEISQNSANIALNLALLYREIDELDSAMTFLTKAEHIQKELQDFRGLSKTIHNKGLVTERQGDFEKTLSFYETALSIADTTDNLITTLEIVQSLLEYHVKQGNKIAGDYFIRFKWMNDTLNQLKTDEELVKQRVAYEVGKKEQENQYLQVENKNLAQENLIDARENQLLWTVLFGTGILILGIIALFLFYRQRQITTKLKDQSRINKMIQEQDKKYFSAMLEGQEKERQRMSEELHDRMGGLLSAIKIHFGNLSDEIKAKSQPYETTENLLNIAIDEIRKISNDMMSGVLVNFGLVAALHDLADTINDADQLQIKIISVGLEDRLKGSIEINCFRIMQELVTNALKHAKAYQMQIRLRKKKKSLIMHISDDGIGFNWDKSKHEQGLGLKNIERRVKALEGEIEVVSTPGNGTNYTIIIKTEEQ